METKNKNYTNFVAVTAINSQGNKYVHAGICSTVCKITSRVYEKEGNTSTVVNASVCVNHRNAYLNSLLGMSLPAGTRETPVEEATWVKLTFWNEKATRFLNFLKAKNIPVDGTGKIRLAVFGALKKDTFTDRNGQPREGVAMSVNEFWNMSGGNSQNAQTSDNSSSVNPPADCVPTPDSDGFYPALDDNADFISMNDDGEVPF